MFCKNKYVSIEITMASILRQYNRYPLILGQYLIVVEFISREVLQKLIPHAYDISSLIQITCLYESIDQIGENNLFNH